MRTTMKRTRRAAAGSLLLIAVLVLFPSGTVPAADDAAPAPAPDDAAATPVPGAEAAPAPGPSDAVATPEPPPSAEQADAPRDAGVVYERVVVTANRAPQQERDVPANVTVLTAEDIEATAGLATDEILRNVPGVSATRQQSSIGGVASTQVLNVRSLGGGSSRTLVLLDGVPLNDPYGGHIYWSRVPRASIERVEVVRGAGSNVWGNRAMAGVVSLFTKRPSGRKLEVSALTGQRNTAGLDLFASDRFGPVAVSIAASGFDTDGYQVFRQDLRGSVDEPYAKQYQSYAFKLEAPLSERSNLFFRGSYLGENQHEGTAIRREETDIREFVAGADFTGDAGNEWRFHVVANDKGSNVWDAAIARDRDSEELNEFIDQPASSVGASAVWSRTVGRHHGLMAGADWLWIDTEYNQRTDVVDGAFTGRREIPGKQQLGGVFLQDLVTLGPRWRLTAAGRLDYLRNYDGATRITEAGSTVESVDYDAFSETTFNPNLGVVFHATPTVSWRAAAYRGFRAPDAGELYRGSMTRGGVVVAPNPDLDPEHLMGVESGMSFARKKLGGQVTLFWNEIRDLVAIVDVQEQGPTGGTIEPCGFVEADGICRVRTNIGALTVEGVEADLDYRPSPSWSLSLSYLHEDAEFSDAPSEPELEGLTPRHVPDDAYTARVGYSDARLLSASIRGRYVGERFEDDNNRLPVGSLFVVDLTASRRLAPGVTLFADVENLLDEEYEIRRTSSGLVEIGAPRWVYGGLRLSF